MSDQGHVGDLLRRVQAEQRELAARGWDWPSLSGILDKLEEELREIRDAVSVGDQARVAEELGDLLLASVHACNHLGADAEEVLVCALLKLKKRITSAEKLLRQEGLNPVTCSTEMLDRVWTKAKGIEL